MPRTIAMAVRFPCSAAKLYRMYLEPKPHAAFTGAPVKIAARAGAPFEAFGGAITGTILQVIPNRCPTAILPEFPKDGPTTTGGPGDDS